MPNFFNLILLFLVSVSVNSSTTVEQELCQHVYDSCPSLQHHVNVPRPFQPNDNRTFIETYVYPLVLVEIDDYNQRLSMTAAFEVYWMLENSSAWYSESLSEEAKRLNSCKFHMGNLWKPHVMLLNNVDKDNPLSQYFSNFIHVKHPRLSFEHNVSIANYFIWTTFTTSCFIDPQMYPFNNANCNWDFYLGDLGWDVDVSWYNFNVSLVDNSGGFIMNDVKLVPPNSLWKFLSYEIINGYQLGSTSASYRVVFKFERKTQYYIVAIFIPLLLIIITQLAVFILPPTNLERIGISVTVMLAVSVMQPILVEDVPKTGQPVYLFYYIQGHVGLNSITTIYMLAVGVFANGQNEKNNQKIRRFDLMACFICFLLIFIFNLIFFIGVTVE